MRRYRVTPIGSTIFCDIKREKIHTEETDTVYVLHSLSLGDVLLYCMRKKVSKGLQYEFSTGSPFNGRFWEKNIGTLK